MNTASERNGQGASPAAGDVAGTANARTRIPRGILARLFVFAFLVYFLTASGRDYSYDGSVMYALTQALVEHRSWVVEEYVGTRYSKYGPLQSVLATPLYAAAKGLRAVVGDFPGDERFAEWSVCFFNVFVTSVSVVVMAAAAAELGVGVAAAAVTALVWGFATMAWPYAKQDFSEPLLCLLMLLTSLYCMRSAGGGRVRDAALAGLFFGLTLLTKYANAAVGPLFFMAAAAFPLKKWPGRAAAFGAAAAFGLFFVLLYNYARFHSPFETGYDLQNEMRLFKPPGSWFEAIYGLFLSSGKSVFLFNPPLILFFGALFGYPRRGRAMLGYILAAFVVYCYVYTRFSYWGGGMAWGPRYHMPFVALGVMLSAPVIDRALRGAVLARTLLGAVVALGVAVQIIGVGVRFNIIYDHGSAPECIHIWFSGNTAYTAAERAALKPVCGNPILKQGKVLLRRTPRMSRLTADALRGKLPPGGKYGGSYLDFWWAYWLPMLPTNAARALTAFLAALTLGTAALGWNLRRALLRESATAS